MKDLTPKAAALRYAALGIPVFPCNSSKAPHINGGFHKATVDAKQIEKWWSAWPAAMIGYPTGTTSGIDVLDLDFDLEKGKNGLSQIPDWKNRSSLIVRTPRGGVHLLYKSKGLVRNTTDTIAHGVDTRGIGGYAILPPSVNGAGPYRFEIGDEAAFSQLSEFPADLFKKLNFGERRNATPNEELVLENKALIPYAVAAIPNKQAGWEEWNRIGMAIWSAAGGDNEIGFAAFDKWSQKSTKYNAKETQKKWDAYFRSPVDSIGAGTLIFLASQEQPNWDAGYYRELERRLNEANSNPDALIEFGGGLATKGVEQNIVHDPLPVAKAETAIGGGSNNGGSGDGGGSNDDGEEGENAAPITLSEMNSKYAVIVDGGKVLVIMFEKNVEQVGLHRHERAVPMFMSFEDFRNLHLNKKIKYIKTSRSKDGSVSEKVVTTSAGAWWLNHRKRKEYDGIIFDPSGGEVVHGKLNLWRGWGVTPEPGDWSLMKEHIKIVLAAGDKDNFNYIINWLAWAVQHPEQRAEVALVFKGGRGSGKGTLGNAMCRIFGQHGVHISNAKHLTGFNAHLRDACFLFADEAYWPGDKSAEGDLKRLITEPELFIRAMRRDGVMVDNMLHVMMASNEEWIVPAGEKERRYAAFLCDDQHIQSEKWFGPIHKQLRDGGYAAMLHDLLAMDLGPWHPRKIPEGERKELLNQQARSLEPLDAWWVELLETGQLAGSEDWNPCAAVSNEFYDENKGHDSPGLYDQARSVEPRLRGRNDHTLGHFLKSKGCGNTKRVRRRRGWTFPPLEGLRKDWVARFPGWRWRDPDLSGWSAVSDDFWGKEPEKSSPEKGV